MKDKTKTIIIVNTVLVVLGFVPSFGLQLASVMGGASAASMGGFVEVLGSFIAFAGIILPGTLIVSLLGSWIAFVFKAKRVALIFCALPWAHLLLLLIAIGVLFTL